MEYIKNNYKAILVAFALIVSLVAVILDNRQEREELKVTFKEQLRVKDSLHYLDSTYSKSLTIKIDSLSKEIHFRDSIDINTSVENKGKYRYEVIVEVIRPDGTIEKRKEIIEIDTTKIAQKRITQVIDSLKKELTKTVYIHDTTYVDKIQYVKDTKIERVVEKESVYVKITNPVKKLSLSGLAGFETTLDLDYSPVIGIGSQYDFMPPFFGDISVEKTGNVLNYGNRSDYRARISVGAKLKF